VAKDPTEPRRDKSAMTARVFCPSLGPDDDVDQAFDSVYPDWVRCHSARHWTPVEVAQRAAELLVTSACTRVLDVGAGAGKFCIVGALTTQGRFCGVEQRAHLVEVAREAADHYGARRVHFIHGDITSIDWREFNAFYLYNPFSEHVTGPFGAIDPSITFAPALREMYIRFTKAQLAAAPVGTRVVTYHGFGGQMPPGFRCARREGRGSDFVELWIKEPTALWIPPFTVEDRGVRGSRIACALGSGDVDAR
jgi:SAM-dependent methyltransferase